MAFLQTKNVSIKGFSACVPQKTEENLFSSVFESEDAASKFIATTGVERKRCAATDVTTSDMCLKAAEKLIDTLKWKKEDIDCLIFVTQTPDYILPATSCLLQDRLGLSQECYTLDISLGCSGWVYGLSTIASLMSSGNLKKGLLLAGDTTLRPTSPKDKSAWPLFGDAGTATALQFEEGADGFDFHLATDGSGYEAIIIPDGGYRNPINEESFLYEKIDEGIERNRTHTILNGMDVFSFGISKAPESVNKLSEKFNLNHDNIDYFVFHQANMFMNEKIRKKLKLPAEKVPYSLKNYGNTSSATIPLTIISELQDVVQKNDVSFVGCGFGVGLSWGSVYFKTNRIICCDIIEI